MKGNLRVVLYVLAAGLMFVLWQKWQLANQPQEPAEVVSQSAPSSLSSGESDEVARAPTYQPRERQSGVVSGSGAPPTEKGNTLVRVKTDVFDLTIASRGATIIDGKLLDYAESDETDTPLALIREQNPARMVLESGLAAADKASAPTHFDEWRSEQTEYVLEDGEDELSVPFTWINDRGITVTKTYVFHRGSYRFVLKQTVDNASSLPWQGFAYGQLAFGQALERKGLGHVASFTGAVTSSAEKRYHKIKLGDIADKEVAKLDLSSNDGWVAMMQHYFIAALVPNRGDESRFYTNYIKGDHIVGVHGEGVVIAPGTAHTFQLTSYVGPKIEKNLDAVAPYLDKTIDYGYLFMISQFMFKVMEIIHHVVGNWGWAIVFMTVLIKLIFFFPSAWAYKSMAKMRALQPQMAHLKERFGDDRQAMSQAMMKLYRQEKVNPASGCLPMLLQIPFFIAFYWVLAESVQLRQAPWLGWIDDLSVMDPYFILPVTNAALMFLQQKLNPPPPDPMQAKVMMMLPLIFGIMFLWFPSGLVLYWTVSNAFSIVQQYIMNKRYGTARKAHNHHRANAKA